jgi:hypothetical protein
VNKGPSDDPSAIPGKAKVDVAVLALRADIVNSRVDGAKDGRGADAKPGAGELREGGKEGGREEGKGRDSINIQ